MDFELRDDQLQLRETLRAFFSKEAPTSEINRLDSAEEFPSAIYAKMAELGLCGITIPEEYGGAPLDQISITVVMEEIARAAGCLMYAFAPTVMFCAVGIAQWGTEEQKRAYLPAIAAGRMRIAMGLSEPDAGSDLSHLRTSAREDGDHYIVKGQKIWTTGADTADLIMTFVRTDPNQTRHRGLSILLIDRRSAGVTTRPIPKLSGQATHTCEVFFDSVRVPKANLLGKLGEGAQVIFGLLDEERIYVAAQSCGIAQGAFDIALRYAKERRQFGVEIIEHQAVGHMLADMAMDIHAARLVTWHAAWRLETNKSCSKEASMAKVVASENATRCISRAMQVLGGYSYSKEFALERYWRETKLYEIAGGTNQIQRNIITKQLRREDGGI
jgi:alkylation response protein AidB-like acyl-CoA dehydrogenase